MIHNPQPGEIWSWAYSPKMQETGLSKETILGLVLGKIVYQEREPLYSVFVLNSQKCEYWSFSHNEVTYTKIESA